MSQQPPDELDLLLAKAPPPEAPAWFEARTLARLRREKEQAPSGIAALLGGLGGATALFAIFFSAPAAFIRFSSSLLGRKSLGRLGGATALFAIFFSAPAAFIRFSTSLLGGKSLGGKSLGGESLGGWLRPLIVASPAVAILVALAVYWTADPSQDAGSPANVATSQPAETLTTPSANPDTAPLTRQSSQVASRTATEEEATDSQKIEDSQIIAAFEAFESYQEEQELWTVDTYW